VKGHDAHAERLANIPLRFAGAGKFICPGELQSDFLVRMLLHFPA
jgi:hypothetical protein